VLSTYNWDRIAKDNLEVYKTAIEAIPQTV
jgi:hypothetical protein